MLKILLSQNLIIYMLMYLLCPPRETTLIITRANASILFVGFQRFFATVSLIFFFGFQRFFATVSLIFFFFFFFKGSLASVYQIVVGLVNFLLHFPKTLFWLPLFLGFFATVSLLGYARRFLVPVTLINRVCTAEASLSQSLVNSSWSLSPPGFFSDTTNF